MDQKLRMAIIGCGFFGQKHADVFDQIANAELVAVCDIDPATAQMVGEQYGVENAEGHLAGITVHTRINRDGKHTGVAAIRALAEGGLYPKTLWEAK